MDKNTNAETGGRLLIVSNRLPITVATDASSNAFTCKRSTGGLVAGLSGLAKNTQFMWYGWPGISVQSEAMQRDMREHLRKEYDAVPMFLPDSVAKDYYSGFCNGILWPLFHYHPNELSFNPAHYAAYTAANRLFAQCLAEDIQPGDVVWIHDFHLMLLPSLLNQLLHPNLRAAVKIGFFLHTPFPSSEVYRILPVRKELLIGVLGGSDCVGFQTYDYARHFMSSCARILGLHCFPDGVEFQGRKVKVGTHPIGIDPEKFKTGLHSPTVQSHITRLKTRFKNTKIMIGIDRLDYIKALPQKLHAFSYLLYKHPELRDGNCVLIQVAVPSRGDVVEYQNLERVVDGLVGKVNGRFGTVECVPVYYVHRGVSFEELVALYAVADVCVVSSTRDGMNLVSYEFIASQQGQHGVLVLSEFAGAAQSLNGAIIVNPWNTEELAQGMYDALTMPAKRKEENYHKLSRYVDKYTAERWGNTFVNELKVRGRFRLSVSSAHNGFRVLFIDYDGTLNSTSPRLPEYAQSPSKQARDLLSRLSTLPATFVYVLSGRSRAILDLWFGDLPVGLCAEHGCFYRHPPHLDSALQPFLPPRRMNQGGWNCLVEQPDSSWSDAIRPLFEHYTERTPGSFVEGKEVNLTWNYRNADPEFGDWQASELHVNLEQIVNHLALSVRECGTSCVVTILAKAHSDCCWLKNGGSAALHCRQSHRCAFNSARYSPHVCAHSRKCKISE
ncbi:glycosyltransferase family 20-domain-containing protein [Chytriomyces cf. hyalinus JEL632]|nr:glycosyltransferase family 20-domain-containing protein [Chytriomyces cf. hyalinus JEL632]